jgi:hypothetical protein
MGGRLSLIAEFLNHRPVIVSGFTDLDSSQPSHKDKKIGTWLESLAVTDHAHF